jgi:hypothetical protein
VRTSPDQTQQDLVALTRLLQDLAWNMPSETQQRLKDHLSTEIHGPDLTRSSVRGRWTVTRPRKLRRRAWLLGVGAAMAVMAATVTTIIITSERGLPAASPGAVRLLAKVAAAAGHQPAVQAGDSQYMYSEVKEATWPVPGKLEPFIKKGAFPREIRDHLEKLRPQKFTVQFWTPVSDVCRVGLERIAPSTGPVINWKSSAQGSGFTCPSIGSLNVATYRLLQSLPTDPHALLAMIYKAGRGYGPSPDQEAFVTIGDLLRDKIAPPEVAAALYRAAALIPGVTLVRNATDAIGRQGVAVARTAGGIRTELVFSKTTLRLIGERATLVRTGISGDATAIIRQAFVDHIGQVPTAPKAPGP